jgi:hypothetical protein
LNVKATVDIICLSRYASVHAEIDVLNYPAIRAYAFPQLYISPYDLSLKREWIDFLAYHKVTTSASSFRLLHTDDFSMLLLPAYPHSTRARLIPKYSALSAHLIYSPSLHPAVPKGRESRKTLPAICGIQFYLIPA